MKSQKRTRTCFNKQRSRGYSQSVNLPPDVCLGIVVADRLGTGVTEPTCTDGVGFGLGLAMSPGPFILKILVSIGEMLS